MIPNYRAGSCIRRGHLTWRLRCVVAGWHSSALLCEVPEFCLNERVGLSGLPVAAGPRLLRPDQDDILPNATGATDFLTDRTTGEGGGGGRREKRQ